MNKLLKVSIILTYLGTITCYASSETFTNRVTVEIPSYLFIGSDQKDVKLSFADYRTGAETNAQSISYQVIANNMAQSEGAPAVTARLDGPFPDFDLRIKVGPYTKEGGNTELSAYADDFVSLKDSDLPLAKKSNSLGDGKLLRGQIAMTYKAVATSSLTSGEYSRELTLTLTDI